ncbi:hypothetical protein FQR65_LT09347 [Abscondita terminalis]|nr:hypothetical protein FQR65_LT09347 [Abscondita terminalis]
MRISAILCLLTFVNVELTIEKTSDNSTTTEKTQISTIKPRTDNALDSLIPVNCLPGFDYIRDTRYNINEDKSSSVTSYKEGNINVLNVNQTMEEANKIKDANGIGNNNPSTTTMLESRVYSSAVLPQPSRVVIDFDCTLEYEKIRGGCRPVYT